MSLNDTNCGAWSSRVHWMGAEVSEGIVRMEGRVVPGNVPVLERLGEGLSPTWLTSGGTLRAREAEKSAFSLEEYADRRRRVRESMAELSVRAVAEFRPSSGTARRLRGGRPASRRLPSATE